MVYDHFNHWEVKMSLPSGKALYHFFFPYFCRAWLLERCWNLNFEGLVYLMLMRLLVDIPIWMKALKVVSILFYPEQYNWCWFNRRQSIKSTCLTWLFILKLIFLFFSIISKSISVWANHGDDISFQYTGTLAMKRDFVRYHLAYRFYKQAIKLILFFYFFIFWP